MEKICGGDEKGEEERVRDRLWEEVLDEKEAEHIFCLNADSRHLLPFDPVLYL